MAHGVVRYHF